MRLPKRRQNLSPSEARAAVTARGRFVMAVSGGRTPWQMLRALANEAVPWKDLHVVQVDERVAPPGDPDRNLTHLRESLLEHAPLPPGTNPRHARGRNNLEAAPRVMPDCFNRSPVHRRSWIWPILGLGPDGHTASLVPGDPVLASPTGTLR
jgi:6-phosphogluconolactonase